MLDAIAPLARWQLLKAYQIDERTGEGPEVLLTWHDADGTPHSAIGVGFRHWNTRTSREEILFAVSGRVNRDVTHFRELDMPGRAG